MKNSKIYILLLLTILFWGTSSAQKTGFYWFDLNENSNRLAGKLSGKVYYPDYLANAFHFYHDNWVDATLSLTDGDVFSPIKLKYLAYGDQIIAFNQNVGTLFKIEKETVEQFEYRDESSGVQVRFIKLCSDSLFNGCRYLEVLYSGNSQLLAFHYVEHVKVHPYKDKLGILRDREYRAYTSYVVRNKQGELLRLNRSKRSLLRNYRLHKKEIRKLLRKHKLQVFNQNSFVQAFKLVDEAGLIQ